MKYILSQAELDSLREERRRRNRAEDKKLQEFCTLAASHIPIKRPWSPSGEPAPWGCILLPEGAGNPGYCDCCPAQDFCPSERKEFSQ